MTSETQAMGLHLQSAVTNMLLDQPVAPVGTQTHEGMKHNPRKPRQSIHFTYPSTTVSEQETEGITF